MAKPLAKSLSRPYPAPLPQLDLDAARSEGGARLLDDRGVCVANYKLRDYQLSWFMDDRCAAEQIGVILPEVSAYSAGMLDHLFRGALVMAPDGDGLAVQPAGMDLGAGTIQFFWDDGRGVRTPLADPKAIERAVADQPMVRIEAVPKGTAAVAALYKGQDGNGEAVIAAGYFSLIRSAEKTP